MRDNPLWSVENENNRRRVSGVEGVLLSLPTSTIFPSPHLILVFFVTKSVGGEGKSQYIRFLAARGRVVTSRAPCHLTSTGHSPHVTGCHALVTGNHSERCAGRAARPRLLLSKADGSKGAGKQLTILCGLISNWLCRRRRMLASSVGARQHAGL